MLLNTPYLCGADIFYVTGGSTPIMTYISAKLTYIILLYVYHSK